MTQTSLLVNPNWFLMSLFFGLAAAGVALLFIVGGGS
jgi:hypothetical protein